MLMSSMKHGRNIFLNMREFQWDYNRVASYKIEDIDMDALLYDIEADCCSNCSDGKFHFELSCIYSTDKNPHIFPFSVKWEQDEEGFYFGIYEYRG